jgi:putative lipoprotein
MNKLSYTPIALVLILTMSASKCNDKTAEAAGGVDKIGTILDSKWILQTVKGNTVTMPDGIEMPWLKLSAEGNGLEGFGGCNQLMGSFELQGDRISFPSLGSTKKFCEATMPVENTFKSALNNTDGFKADGDLLKLLSQGSEVATFKSE